jgi:protein-tyrosine phosphatase
MALEWVRAGAALQLDVESLLGLWGRGAERCATRLLNLGLVTALASDAHSTKRRPPRMTEGLARATSLLGDTAGLLVNEGPAGLLAGRLAEYVRTDGVETGSAARRRSSARGWRGLFSRGKS